MDQGAPRDFLRDDLCFACGQENAAGLRLKPEAGEGRAVVRWVPPDRYQGYAGIVHGGVISTLLDETMAHAALSLAGRAPTCELNLRFLRPVRTGVALEVRAQVREHGRRILVISAELLQEGEVRARGEGKFLVLAPERRP